jgi:hypothetical protein
MYGYSCYDVDGHHWEVLWMDPAFVHKSQYDNRLMCSPRCTLSHRTVKDASLC